MIRCKDRSYVYNQKDNTCLYALQGKEIYMDGTGRCEYRASRRRPASTPRKYPIQLYKITR